MLEGGKLTGVKNKGGGEHRERGSRPRRALLSTSGENTWTLILKIRGGEVWSIKKDRDQRRRVLSFGLSGEGKKGSAETRRERGMGQL